MKNPFESAFIEKKNALVLMILSWKKQ